MTERATAPLTAPTLPGGLVRLEPLTIDHGAGLAAAAAEDRATYGYTEVPDGVASAASYVRAGLASDDRVPFAQVRVVDGQVVGATSYLNLRRRPDGGALFALEIGGTWLATSAQRTGINVEAKLLLLRHAFEEWGVERVDLKTDARNRRARTALERLGASFEGVLRRWQPSQVPGEEGRLRDTAMFSVVAPEWPAVEAGLRARLG